MAIQFDAYHVQMFRHISNREFANILELWTAILRHARDTRPDFEINVLDGMMLPQSGPRPTFALRCDIRDFPDSTDGYPSTHICASIIHSTSLDFAGNQCLIEGSEALINPRYRDGIGLIVWNSNVIVPPGTPFLQGAWIHDCKIRGPGLLYGSTVTKSSHDFARNRPELLKLGLLGGLPCSGSVNIQEHELAVFLDTSVMRGARRLDIGSFIVLVYFLNVIVVTRGSGGVHFFAGSPIVELAFKAHGYARRPFCGSLWPWACEGPS
jgi:hypothetical protein